MNVLTALYSAYNHVWTHLLDPIFHIEPSISTKEAFSRIDQEALHLDQIDRKKLWGWFAENQEPTISHLLDRIVTKFDKEKVQSKTALDLGCGNGTATLHLLKKGWTVIAIDSSKKVLLQLKKKANRINSSWIQNDKLTLVCNSIEDYQFPKNVTLIHASSSLPYTDPTKLKTVWGKIYNALDVGGRLVGNFFTYSSIPRINFIRRALENAWFTDIDSVRSLLHYQNYKPEVCKYTNPWFCEEQHVEYSAQKIHPPLPKKRRYTIRTSSYYDAVRALPSSSSFPHAYPYFVDKIVQLREASKLTTLASGILGLIESTYQPSRSISSYALIASLGAWVIFKLLADQMEPKAKSYVKKARSLNYDNHPALQAEKEKIQVYQKSKRIQDLLNPPSLQKMFADAVLRITAADNSQTLQYLLGAM